MLNVLLKHNLKIFKKELVWYSFKTYRLCKEKIYRTIFKFSKISEVDIDDIAVIRSEQQRRKKLEEWSCKTLKDWMRLAEKRGHNPNFGLRKDGNLERSKNLEITTMMTSSLGSDVIGR